jgi:ATP-dependent DNA helicase RecG
MLWERKSKTDWSVEVCPDATIADLDEEAIHKARLEYKNKFPGKESEVDSWDDIQFLNKTKITKKGAITNTAILLLGKPEAATLIAPAVAKISWILKDENNQEKSYEHFGPPFLLNVDKVFARIRNLTSRFFPSGTLFPIETTQYDPWVVREALHNCIAHQDYSLRGRINVVETPYSLILTNRGSFLPGSIETVIEQDAPQEIYRNHFLADAMVNLNMIDTQGGGIKKMFQIQMKRFFPLPDYDLSHPDRVMVRIRGEVLDERYSKLLMERTNLDFGTVILLDKVQKRIPITKEQNKYLKSMNVVEGRYPNIFVSSRIAAVTEEKARHIRDRGLEKKHYKELIIGLVQKHQPVTRNDIDELLLDKLPEILSEQQKKAKLHNLISELAEKHIKNIGSRRRPRWVLIRSKDDDTTKKQ